MPHALDDQIATVLRTPAGTRQDAAFGFDALEADGRTKADLSEQVLAAMAREALTRSIPGVTFNSIVAHRDEHGQLMAVEIDYMDEVHDPSSRTTKVVFDGEAG